jgi:hypothetical protein
MAECVDGGGPRCLFRELDRDSRWSTASIYRLLTQMRELIERSYPPERRAAALGAWADESRAADPAALFETFCNKRRCLTQLARGFGAVTQVKETSSDRAEIVTTRGAVFTMARADDEWGLATFGDELQQAKIHLGDALTQVRRNAEAYDEQQLVSGKAEGSSK